MNNLPFQRPGRFYRGNLHCHSTNSDGGMSPEQVCRVYREQGYDFLALTDHFSPEFDFPVSDTRPYRCSEFTTILGAELHAPALANGQEWHILGVGLPLDFPGLKPGETGPQLAQRAADAGAFIALAHPVWYGATVEDLQTVPVAHAVEAYNEVCGGLTDRAESWFHVDQLLSAGRRIFAIGADDAHFRDFSSLPELPKPGEDDTEFMKALRETASAPDGSGVGDTFAAGFSTWVWVRAEALEPDSLVESLKAGHFYTSQGPRILDIAISDDQKKLVVSNTPAVSVYVTGDPSVISVSANHARQITRTEFSIEFYKGTYCRVTVVDAAGNRAWSNPIWLD